MHDVRVVGLIHRAILIAFRVISNSIQLLVQDTENACDAPLTAMTKVSLG